MRLRLLAALLIAVLFAVGQILVVLDGSPQTSARSGSPSNRLAPSVAHAQDEDEDEEDDDEDDDDDDDDDEDEDDEDDDEDEDEDDEDDDNEEDEDVDDDEDADNEDGGDEDADDDGVTSAPAPPAVPATLADTPATGTSNGGDVTIALSEERVTVRIFPWMPNGVALTVKKIDPATVAAAPGTRAGDLAFAIEARDATGATLTTLPAEVNLAVRYNDADVSGLTESNLTLSRLDTASNQWRAAPKQVKEAANNYIAASIMDLGTYAVHAP